MSGRRLILLIVIVVVLAAGAGTRTVARQQAAGSRARLCPLPGMSLESVTSAGSAAAGRRLMPLSCISACLAGRSEPLVMQPSRI